MAELDCCNICANVYTSVLRKKITCMFCNKDTCSKCIEQYLVGRPEEAHCLHCRVNYHAESLQKICTKTYLKQVYFQHRQEVLIAKEKANLPLYQDAAIRRKKLQVHLKEKAAITVEKNSLEKMKRDLDDEYSTYLIRYKSQKVNNEDTSETENKIKEYHAKIDSFNELIRDKVEEKRRHDWDFHHQDQTNNDEKEKEKERKKFIRRCTRDNCQGFLSNVWKCAYISKKK